MGSVGIKTVGCYAHDDGAVMLVCCVWMPVLGVSMSSKIETAGFTAYHSEHSDGACMLVCCPRTLYVMRSTRLAKLFCHPELLMLLRLT